MQTLFNIELPKKQKNLVTPVDQQDLTKKKAFENLTITFQWKKMVPKNIKSKFIRKIKGTSQNSRY